MIHGKTLVSVLEKLIKKSEVGGFARVQVQMPNGDLHDIAEIRLMNNMLVGQTESHRIVLKTEPERHKMSKVIKSTQIV